MLFCFVWFFKRNIAGARDPEVLSLFAQAIEKLGENVAQYVPRIMEAVFECTLLMITRNFEVFTFAYAVCEGTHARAARGEGGGVLNHEGRKGRNFLVFFTDLCPCRHGTARFRSCHGWILPCFTHTFLEYIEKHK